MAPKQRLVYWDSCVFIHVLQQTEQWKPTLSAMVTAAQAGDIQIVTSALTLVEALGKRPADFQPDDEVLVRQLFENPYIIVRDVTRQIADEARRIVCGNHGVKCKDAIHVATALAAGAHVLHTCDGGGDHRGLLQASGKIGTPPLSIALPSLTAQPRLMPPPELTEDGKTGPSAVDLAD